MGVVWKDEVAVQGYAVSVNDAEAHAVILLPVFEARRLKAFLDATLPEYADDGTRRD